MKVAVLSDIHGNFFALDAVIKEFPPEIQELWVLGDITGYYYQTKEVLGLLKKFPVKAVLGNHEQVLMQTFDSEDIGDNYYNKYGSSLKVAAETLSQRELDYLFNLPMTLNTTEDILLSHGSPWNFKEYVYQDADKSILDKFIYFAETIFFIGHTHHQMCISYRGKTIINPGSVGQPRNNKTGAHWAIFDTETYQLEFRTTLYDLSPLLQLIEKIDPQNNYLKTVLIKK
jgi:predicted phosphodiesterase